MRGALTTIAIAALVCCSPRQLHAYQEAEADELQEEFSARVAAIYDFEPYTTPEEELDAKIVEMDEFWAYVGADPDNRLPQLRRELAESAHASFFFYDAAKLLLSLSTDRADQALALSSIPKADLQGVQHGDYLQLVHWFAQNGFDVRDAAFRILAFPDFIAFIPQHALTLRQDYALIYMLFPLDEAVYMDDLLSRLETESQVESQRSLLLALWYTVTPAGAAALERFAADESNAEEARAYAEELLSVPVPEGNTDTLSSVSSLKDERRQIMLRPISDEALFEFNRFTAELLAHQGNE